MAAYKIPSLPPIPSLGDVDRLHGWHGVRNQIASGLFLAMRGPQFGIEGWGDYLGDRHDDAVRSNHSGQTVVSFEWNYLRLSFGNQRGFDQKKRGM